MTDNQKKLIQAYRGKGMSYKEIADTLSISINTIKAFCKRNGLGGIGRRKAIKIEEHLCNCCGKTMIQQPGRKVKKFCSDKCRNKWWNEHLDQVNRRAVYEYVCNYCKTSFTAYGNSKRKYCSHSCYIADRFGGEK